MMRDLILDVGMNNGADTRYYLQKGFRVVAVEADPLLCEQARADFADEVDSGRLTILNIGVGVGSGSFKFYRNVDHADWSSFDPAWAGRDNTRVEEIDVECVPFEEVLLRHGVPYYVKIDIEGKDIEVVRSLTRLGSRPQYVSVEEHDVFYFGELYAAGYRKFQMVNQTAHNQRGQVGPSLEGFDVEAPFPQGASGPFGRDLPGHWLPFGDAVATYLRTIRDETGKYLATGWYDIHASLD